LFDFESVTELMEMAPLVPAGLAETETTIASLTATDVVNVTTRVADEVVEFPLAICETDRAIVSSPLS